MTDPQPPDSTPEPKRRSSKRPLIGLLLVCAVAALGAEGVRAWVQQQRADELRAVARPGDIRMISQTTCVYCTKAREWLTRHEVPFEECFIDRDSECLAEYNRQGRNGTPMMLLRGEMQRGFDAQRVTASLARHSPAAAATEH